MSLPPKGIVTATTCVRLALSFLGKEIQEARLKQPLVLAADCEAAVTMQVVHSSNSYISSANFLL